MEDLKEQIETIVNKTIEENEWEKLSSKDYEEFMKVTEIGEQIIFQGKKIKPEEVTDILEELEFCKRKGTVIRLTEKGKKYGRYAISIYLSKSNPIITDKAYVKYKIEIKEIIEKFIEENPQFILAKREERKNKRNETKKRNKEQKEKNKEE